MRFHFDFTSISFRFLFLSFLRITYRQCPYPFWLKLVQVAIQPSELDLVSATSSLHCVLPCALMWPHSSGFDASLDNDCFGAGAQNWVEQQRVDNNARRVFLSLVLFFCCRASFFGNLVLSICGTMLKLTFVVSSYVVVGVALPIALALFSLQGLGRFLHYVIMQPKQRAAGSRTLRKALKKVARRLDKKRRKALRPLRCSLGKHFLFWQRCTKICMQCVDWIFLFAKLYLCHCALLLLAALMRLASWMAMAYFLGLLIARVYLRTSLSHPLPRNILSGLERRGGSWNVCYVLVASFFCNHLIV